MVSPPALVAGLVLGLASQSLASVVRFAPRHYPNTTSTSASNIASNITAHTRPSYGGGNNDSDGAHAGKPPRLPPLASPGSGKPPSAIPVIYNTTAGGHKAPVQSPLNLTVVPAIPDGMPGAKWEQVTIEICNTKDETIPLSISRNPGSPPLWADGGSSYLYPHETVTVYADPGFAGRVALGHHEGSKIELSYVSPWYVPHLDVSYVDGFTHELVCSCGDTPVTGCNKNLWKLGDCPTYDRGSEVCLNPSRPHDWGPAHAWFAPCKGTAYTYPHDDKADVACPLGNTIKCCVGSQCDAPERQPY
ncbi:MAG: hypothetical protein MMC23_008355 [Stictis urceolatum]|nr:hypothetical protein [Stictis urceolata]